jgi:hypothetical protein
MHLQKEVPRKNIKQTHIVTVLACIGFSILFVILFTKVTHMSPCEILANYNINTQTCEFAKMDVRTAEASNSIYKYAAEVHGRGFVIITQYALLIVEALDHFVQYLTGYSYGIYNHAMEVYTDSYVIITQYALLIVEALDHFVQALNELVQTVPDCHICHF